jgi:FkbM family methyltransferase
MCSASADATEFSRVGSLSRWRYYVGSIPTLLLRIRPPLRVLSAFLGFPGRRPFGIELSTGCRFRVRGRMDIWIIKETCLDRDYERGFVPVENGWTVIDLGAGLGDFAICTARQCPDSTVYAFEPLSESYALLLANLELNRLANVRTFPLAVAASAGRLYMATKAGFAERSRTLSQEQAAATVPVEAITLDQVFERLKVERCDFLKIDCEGAEYDILFGASEVALRRIQRVAMEYHEGVTRFGRDDLVRFLEERGFRVRTRRNPAHREIGFLFASREEDVPPTHQGTPWRPDGVLKRPTGIALDPLGRVVSDRETQHLYLWSLADVLR